MMSFGELLVVAIVALLVMKPEDIPIIVKQLAKVKDYFTKVKNDFYSEITTEVTGQNDLTIDNVEEINFYLEKILSIEGKYEGKYELEAIKSSYHKLVKAQASLYKAQQQPTNKIT